LADRSWPIVTPSHLFTAELLTHQVQPARQSPPPNFANLTVIPRAGGFWHLKSCGCSGAKSSASAVRGIGAKTAIIAAIRHKQHQRRTTMPAIRVYGIKNCDTMKKAIELAFRTTVLPTNSSTTRRPALRRQQPARLEPPGRLGKAAQHARPDVEETERCERADVNETKALAADGCNIRP
jgi:hypothetical protein